MPTILTEKQELILKFIKNHIALKGYAPSIKEIQKEFQIKYKRGVVQYLEALVKKGYITRSSKPRGIHIVEQYLSTTDQFIQVPVLGYANAGEPLSFAYQDKIGTIQLDRKLISTKEKLFALIVKGDSMNRRRLNYIPIRDGNYVIVSKTNDVYDGDVVLAIIDDCATIKTYKRSGSTIVLYPESDNIVHRPIYLSEESNALINGKVLTVLDNISFQK